MSDSIKAWPNWQDGAPSVPGPFAVEMGYGGLNLFIVSSVSNAGVWASGFGHVTGIVRHCPLPDFAAMVAERDALRAEVERLASAVNEANERADRAERNAADPLPWGGK